ncbi:MAG: CHC2 zinc finger domain-containing protein [Dehalococcoidia bacterium]
MTTPLSAHYSTLADSPDPDRRCLAARQLARLERAAAPTGEAARPSRWAHVPLAALFEQAGNTLYERQNGRIETGHEPTHGSKSGRCVLIDPAMGRWYCRGCRRGGDAVTFLMDINGWNYHRAVVTLQERYGVPADRGLKQGRGEGNG